MFPRDGRPEPMALHDMPAFTPNPPLSPCDCGKYNLKMEPLEVEGQHVHTPGRCGRWLKVVLSATSVHPYEIEWVSA
jgi:hypothetical protein